VNDPPIRFRGEWLSARKIFFAGTHRCRPPEETYERIQPHFRAMGLTRLANITGLDRIGVTTYVAYRPNARTLSTAAGKGFTDIAAKVSAAMEAIELHHAENVRLPVVEDTYDSLARQAAIVPADRLPVTRRSLFRRDRAELWVEGWDLMTEQEMLVPYSAVTMVRHPRQKPRHGMPFVIDSNGLASGNHLLEAACSALLEVIERDALSCHMLASYRVQHEFPRVRMETIEDPLVLELIDRFRRADMAPILYDCTVDTGVPVYMANIYDDLVRNVGIVRGFGAHLDPGIAMIRALTEAAQGRLVHISGARDDMFRQEMEAFRVKDSDAQVASLQAVPPTVDARERRSEATSTFQGDLAVLLRKLAAAGLEHAVLVDLSFEEIGIPVARVTVPGLEGYSSRTYTAGRRATAFCAECAAAH
jgi:ribosomal protein S12 methylthiotransferase accessory factor